MVRVLRALVVLAAFMIAPGPLGAQVVCQLGPAVMPFSLAFNQPPAPYAVQELQTIYQLLCPNGCGSTQLYMNVTAPNALTMVTAPGVSLIAYNPQFMGNLYNGIGPEASFGVMAHEFGHHIDISYTPPWMSNAWSRELKADAWAGCALARRGFNTVHLASALQAIAAYPSPSHPGWDLRIPAVQHGFVSCGGQPNQLPWN